MKKHVFTLLIIIICAVFIYYNVQTPQKYEVIEVYGSGTMCIDLNNDKNCQNEEKLKLFGISEFPYKFGKQSNFIKQRYSIDEKDIVVLGVLSKEYSEKEILNKYVTIDILDNKNKFKLAKIKLNNTDYAQTLLKNGWALAPNNNDYKIFENLAAVKKNIKYSKNFNYRLKNNKTGKIHTLDCEYGRASADYEIGIFDDEKYKKDYCNFCHKSEEIAQKAPDNFPSMKNYDYITDNIKVYFTDFTKTSKPNSACITNVCKDLRNRIDNTKETIDFAIYGFGNVPEIQNSLSLAEKRGVKIRYVIDENSKKQNLYDNTKNLTSVLNNYKTDYVKGESSKYNNFIMHNKFFIFDDNTVWLGSANISETDLSGFSTNNIIIVNSKEFAQIYKAEFERLYNGYCHSRKAQNNIDLPSLSIGNSKLKIGFSPQDKIISNHLIKYINNAKKSIFIESFIITHKSLANALIEAKKRGVDVKIIIDATSASSEYSMVKNLRDNGVKVKVENYAGKMHMKTVLIDDKYFISGSMNLTKSGDVYNDENFVFIENPKLTYNAAAFFYHIWKSIPDKYLYRNISAESKESIGSCSDGIDNDYNGKIDFQDEKCKQN